MSPRTTTKDAVEQSAEDLLADYARYEPITDLPIPVDDMVEFHVGLHLGFTDLEERFGTNGVFGATWADKREVLIDERIEPDTHPDMENHYRFTLGHELGHWQLHPRASDASRPDVMDMTDAEFMTTCHKDFRLESEANRFASCLLIPRDQIYQCWLECYGNLDPIAYTHSKLEGNTEVADLEDWYPGETLEWKTVDEIHPDPFEQIATQFAPRFGVSCQVMQVRLCQVGLLRFRFPPWAFRSQRTQ